MTREEQTIAELRQQLERGKTAFICADREALEHGAMVRKLEAAIRKHRDQKGDDRCWLDDQELYAVLGDRDQADFTLPPREEFLANCERFYERRCRQD